MACRIVVADDNRDSADTLTVLLKLDGHQVEVAHDGERALDMIESTAPDVALLDIGMPGIDGYEIARRIRARHRDIVLVAVTGWAQPQDKVRALTAGFDHHLVKPFEPVAVQDLLALLPCGTGTS